MKKRLLLFVALLFFVSLSSAVCDLSASLINQDPVNAVPGEYVKIVVQLSGVDNPECENVIVRLVPEYPFSLDPGVDPTKVISAGTYTRNYNSQLTIPYNLRVDKDALNDDYSIEMEYSRGTNGSLFQRDTINISVKDVKSDFDIFVQDYVRATNTITFGILNIGKSNAQALTIESFNQENFSVIGSTKAIIGALDANQDSSFSFQGNPKTGSIVLKAEYNDVNGERRSSYSTVYFDESNFPVEAKKGVSSWVYIIGILVIAVVLYFLFRRRPKKKF
jgi:hypothetical protein